MDWEVLRIAFWRTIKYPLYFALGIFVALGIALSVAYYLSPAWAALLMLGGIFVGVLYAATSSEYERIMIRKQQGREWK